MIKDNITTVESGESIKKTADPRREIFDLVRSKIQIRRGRTSCVLQRHQKRHQIGNCRFRKRNRQPEKGATHQVKRKVADQRPPQVQVPVPKKLSVPDRTMCQYIKGDLLYVIVAIQEKKAVVNHQNRQHGNHINQEPGQEHHQWRRKPAPPSSRYGCFLQLSC